MSVAAMIVTFLLIWWVVLFTLLPVQVKGVWEDRDDAHARGVEQGAPISPALRKKLVWTTGITFAVWLVVVAIISSGVISYER